MKKAAGAAAAVLKGILCIGFGIQAAFGILWMYCSIRAPQEYAGDWGVIYRALQAAAKGCPQILCVLQLGVGFCAGCGFLRALGIEKKALNRAGSLVLLTFPMAMQCHLSIAPYSLVSSLFLLELSALIPGMRREWNPGVFFGGLAWGGGCWFLLTMLLPEYFLLGAVPLVLALLPGLRQLLKQPRGLVPALLMLAAFGGMTAGTGMLAGDEGYLPDRETVAYSLFHRLSWPTLWTDWRMWPKEVRDVVGEEAVWAGSEYADAADEYIRCRIEEQFGAEKAAEYFSELATISWNQHKGWIIRKIGGDALGYCATPLILPLQLEGRGYDSCSGRNYEFMTMCAPKLTKYYVRYSCRWFVIMLVVSALLAILVLAENRGRIKGAWLRTVLLCLFWSAAITAAYTLRGAGRMDYKATAGINLLWLAGAWRLYSMGNPAEKSAERTTEEEEKTFRGTQSSL